MNPGKKKGYFELEDIFHIQYILTVLRYEKQKQKKKKKVFPLSIYSSIPLFPGGQIMKDFPMEKFQL